MSRKTIRDAINIARTGRVEEAVSMLKAETDTAIVRMHLRRIKDNVQLVESLFKEVFPNESFQPVQDDEQCAEEIATPNPVHLIPSRVELSSPGPFLEMMSNPGIKRVSLANSQLFELWGIVGLAACARDERQDKLCVDTSFDAPGARFAHALGFSDALDGLDTKTEGEAGRTVRVRRLSDFKDMEPFASRVSHLISPDREEIKQTLYYVLVELLRNVLQHSQDQLGAVVGAQLMNRGQNYTRDAVQVAVVDNGIGILAALKGFHPELSDAAAAIQKALRPHISGTFAEGLTGSDRNAGYGLFMVCELAKAYSGRLLVASRDAALFIRPDPQVPSQHQHIVVTPNGTGFPGTLVAFEIPMEGGPDFVAVLEQIRSRAKQQTPVRDVKRWIQYQNVPTAACSIIVRVALGSEQTTNEVTKSLTLKILGQDPIVLDFAGIDFIGQSSLHALLFKPLRMAWAAQLPVFVVNAAPAVRSALDSLQEYALSG